MLSFLNGLLDRGVSLPQKRHNLGGLCYGSYYLGRFISEIEKIADGLSGLGQPISAVFVKDRGLVEFRLPAGEVYAELRMEGCCCEETDAYVAPGNLPEYAIRQFFILKSRVKVHIADRDRWREYGSRGSFA